MQAKAGQRILVRGVNWLGDAVMSMPALQRLKEARPEAHIALFTSDKTAALWENHPAVNEIIRFSKAEGLWSVSRKLREGKFDLALVLPNSPRSALEVFLAGIPQRVGYARAWRIFLLTKAIRPRTELVMIRPRGVSEVKQAIRENRRVPADWGEGCHHIYDYLELVAELGAKPEPVAPKIYLTGTELQEARKLLTEVEGSQGRWPHQRLSGGASPYERLGGTPRPTSNASEWPGGAPRPTEAGWLGLNPGAEYGPAKRWPSERFVEMALEVHRHSGCGCLIFGGPQDVALGSEIAAGIRHGSGAAVVNLAGQTSLRQFCAALTLCRVLVTNDTGPMHIGAAVGTPVVALFGSTAPELTGPGWPGAPGNVVIRSEAVCSPCFRRECPVDLRCMKGISVSTVVNAVLRRM